MTTPTSTVTDLEARSPACRELAAHYLGLERQLVDWVRWESRSRPTINLELCSSCEYGSHQLCARRIATNGWRPAMECKCLCRFAGPYDDPPGHD